MCKEDRNEKRIIVLGVLFICLLIASLHIYHVAFYKPIPLVDGLSFGVSPQRTKSLFGAHFEKEENTCDTGKNTYAYHAKILGHNATVSCSFMNNKELSDVQIEWNNCDDALFQDVYSNLYSYYSKKESFFENTDEAEQKGNVRVTIGIDNGETGLFYTIEKRGKTVTVYCVDNS